MANGCPENTDPLKLVRDGTTQDERLPNALDPAYVSVDERGPADNMVFAQGYAAFLNYVNTAGALSGDWQPFFSGDISILLAVPAIEDVNEYKTSVQEWFAYLNELENRGKDTDLKQRFGYLFAAIATLAQSLEKLKNSMPDSTTFKSKLQNLIQTQLQPAFTRLIAYRKGGESLGIIEDPVPPIQILRRPAVSFTSVINAGLSTDWTDGTDWAAWVANIPADASVYGDGVSVYGNGVPPPGGGADVFAYINHCSTHTLFKSAFDQFLKVFAGVVSAAGAALNDTLESDTTHAPHYALFLAFLRLLEFARSTGNKLTQRHLDFYYRTILGLQEKSSQPGHVHLLAELAKAAVTRDFKVGETFRAGKDNQGKEVFFANENDFVANHASIAARKSLYRHADEPVGGMQTDQGRIFASPISDSDDGLGAPLTSVDGSWNPFFNKIYTDGQLTEIRMPEAEIGFAIASHYLLMAEGTRVLYCDITVKGFTGSVEFGRKQTELGNLEKDVLSFVRRNKSLAKNNLAADLTFLVTGEKQWLEIKDAYLVPMTSQRFVLVLSIDGSNPPVVPYLPKTHGYNFQTRLPMLLVKLRQDDTRPYAYDLLKNTTVSKISMSVVVTGLKSVAASNDFGPLDTSKPFLPFGGSPVAGSSFVLGSREVFQKQLKSLQIAWNWMVGPTAYPDDPKNLPQVDLDVLTAGAWTQTDDVAVTVESETYLFETDLDEVVEDEPDFSANAFYNTQSRDGYVRLRLTGGFGQEDYQAALIAWLRKDTNATDPGPKPPSGPVATGLSVSYMASADIFLNSAKQDVYDNRPAQFFHLAPFGTAEQHPYLRGGADVTLLPQFVFERNQPTLQSEAEFYIGVAGLLPPQNISILFQVADGTANPLAQKPHPHISWSYLRQNQWVELASEDVQDATGELLNSGIVVLAVPRDATNTDTLIGGGLYWIRAAVHERSDAVCRLQLVAAQAMKAVFADRGNSPDFSAAPLPAGTISKLETPDAAVKSISQPFPSFGGRGKEQPQAFYTRVSERLRHKNRAIDLWDYERIILEAFPQIYRVKCLNHTRYKPSPDGSIDYRELAPGHVTIVTIPNLQALTQRDPLKPYTSLGTLDDIKAFLTARASCFAHLHVENPRFEEVRVRFSVRFFDGFDQSYYKIVLQQSITRFLSPWAFAAGGAPTFEGKVYKSKLIKFVEDLPYVDYVTDFQMFHDIAGPGTVDQDEIEGSLAVSVLVSAPAGKHEITVTNAEQVTALGESCSCGA